MSEKLKLPIKLDETSNGEFAPRPLPAALAWARELAIEKALANAKKLAVDRRKFLASLSGSATTLLMFNKAFATTGQSGGHFEIAAEAEFEEGVAAASLSGDEFIFDVHTHMVDPSAEWRANRGQYWEEILKSFPYGSCGEDDPVDCFASDRFIEEIFVNSDTDLAVLSFVPETPEGNPLTPKEAERTRVLIDRLDGSKRLLLHAMVVPNLKPFDQQLLAMEEAAENWDIAAWKTYTQWGPEGTGWSLDSEDIGIPFIEKARALGIRNICIHKGLPIFGMPMEHSDCADVGRVAKRYPDMNFLVYHSGLMPTKPEGPYDPDNADYGVDSLIRSLIDNGVPPNSNVYADLGATWWLIMRNANIAAHVLGKLLRYVGEDRVLWGTDCIWFGSPQDQIQMMRSFQISDEFAEKFNYSKLTPAIKKKILGANGAQVYGIKPDEVRQHTSIDWIQKTKGARDVRFAQSFDTYGPRSNEEYETLISLRGNMPH